MRLIWHLLLWALASCAAFAQGPVGMVTRQYSDTARVNWRSPGPRPAFTVIWYPAAAGVATTTEWDKSPFADSFVRHALAPEAPLSQVKARYPVVLLSHGSTSVPWSLTWLGAHLAANGYIAAAVAHHGDTGYEGQPLPQGFILMSERVKDLTVVLDRLLADPTFGPHIDRERIGAAGHSSGGETVIAIAGGIFDTENMRAYCDDRPQSPFCAMSPRIRENEEKFEALRKQDPALEELYARQNRSYRDPRVRAVFSLAPAVGPAFTRESLQPVTIPVSIVVGSADEITPSEEHAAHYARLIRGAKLKVIPNAGHMLFGGECTPAGRKKMPVLCQDHPSVDRREVLKQVCADALAFFDRHLNVHRP
jgi:predicted dienelactone hydrolase